MTTPQRLLVPLLSLACLGLGIYAYSEHLARLASEDRLYAAQAENARLTTAQAAPASAAPTMVAEVEPPPAENAPASTPENAPADNNRRRNPPGAMERRAGADFLAALESPEVQQLMNLRARGALDSRFADLFKALNLAPAQLERLQQLLLDKQNTTRDVLAAMRNQGMTPGRESADEMRALVQNANAEIDAQIRSELGEATFARYQEYEATGPQRALVERVQQRLSYSAEPLNDQQAASLVSIFAQTAAARANGGNGGGRNFGGGGGNASISDAALAQAQGVLTAGQMTALQALQQEQQAQAELMRRAREIREQARSTPAPLR